jgi:predicted ATPase with chaperone activity
LITKSVENGAQGSGSEPFLPASPATIAETGLSTTLLEQLILKTLYFRGDVIGRDLADLLALHFSVVGPTIELFRRRRLLEVKGSMGFGDVSAVFALSEMGRTRARDALQDSEYVGPAPVPIAEYTRAVARQRMPAGWVKRDELDAAYKNISFPHEILTQIGLALNSRKSVLIYGKPGNGKTYLAQSIVSLAGPSVFIPHSIECNGQIIQLFDPIHHERIGAADEWQREGYDGRWARCRRPFIVSGGELTLEMLDLAYNPSTKIYDAPLHLKANNGIYLIDDFGRQKASTAQVLNRWILPMEKRMDYLAFRTGEKMETPFDTFLIFSTNLNPESLGDEAFLRRIEYKVLIGSPTVDEFKEIFRQVAESRRLACPDGLISELLVTRYAAGRKPMRRCHPRDILSHSTDILLFEGLPWELTGDVLNRAFESCFVDTSDDDLV